MIEVRDYRTERINRARLSLELRRALQSGIIVAGALVAGALIALHIAHSIGSTVGLSTQSVGFRVASANDVVAQSDEVRYLGIPVGRVTSVTMNGTQPVITASFDTQYGHIYRNATAIVRPNTALEDMYVDIINPGTPSAGLASTSHPLAVDQVDTSVNLDDVLNTFNADTRASLRSLLSNLGNGLADRGASLRDAFVAAVPFVQLAGRVSQQLATRATLVRQLIGSGSATLVTLQDNATNLNATLAALPPTLTDLHSSLASVSSVLGTVDGAVRSLYPLAQQLPSALTAARALGAAASPAVNALQTPVQKLVPLVTDLVPLSHNLSLSVSRLLPQVPALDKTTSDLAACRTGVQGFFQWNPSLAKYGDLRGQAPRGNVAAGLQSSGTFTDPFEQAEVACTPGMPIGGTTVTPASEH